MSSDKTFRVKVKGVSPLIMHSCESADPLNFWAKEMAPVKAKRKKTEADQKKVRDLSFQASLYWSKELNGLYIPVDNVRKMILESGRSCDVRAAKKGVVGIGFTNHVGWALEVENRSNIEALVKDESLRYSKIVTISKAKVPSTRAIFKAWSFEMDVEIDSEIIDPSTVHDWLSYGGKRVGLGSRRPYGPTPGEFGKFYIESFEEIQE